MIQISNYVIFPNRLWTSSTTKPIKLVIDSSKKQKIVLASSSLILTLSTSSRSSKQMGASWKKSLANMMYLRGYVSLHPNSRTCGLTFSTNNTMEPGAHILAKDNVVMHDKSFFKVPLLKEDFRNLLLAGKLPPASKLPSLNLFNQVVSLKRLKDAGAKLKKDVLECDVTIMVHHNTGLPMLCAKF